MALPHSLCIKLPTDFLCSHGILASLPAKNTLDTARQRYHIHESEPLHSRLLVDTCASKPHQC
jgi:hypothetical protein